MINLVYYLKTLLFFDIPKLYYYINLRSSIIFSFFGSIYLSSVIFLSCSFITASALFYGYFLKIFVTLLAISLPIKSPVPPAVFWIVLFEAD